MAFTKRPDRLQQQDGCVSCAYYGEEWDGDYGQIFCGSHCEIHPGYGNLRSFPFKVVKKCHVIDFWHSKHAEKVDGTDESYNKALEDWAAENREKIDANVNLVKAREEAERARLV